MPNFFRLATPLGRAIYWISMAVVTLLTLTALATLAEPVLADGAPWHQPYPTESSNCSSSALAEFALGKVLNDGAPVFGVYADVQNNTSTWLVGLLRRRLR